MPNTNTPRGFRAAKAAHGAPFSGALAGYRIVSGYASSIFTDDAVKLAADGSVQVAAAGDAIRGFARAFRWTGTDGVPVTKAYWPAGTVTLGGADAEVLVMDDPGLEVEARFTGAATVVTNADIGQLYDLNAGTAGNAATGQSGQGVDVTTAATTVKQFRFLGFCSHPDNDTASGYARGRFALVNHAARLQTGI